MLVAAIAPREIFALFLVLVAALALRELFALRRAGAAAAFELALVIVGLVSLVYLRDQTDPPLGIWGSAGALLMTFVAVWAADVGAYLAGSVIGGPKITPRISPGKTWAGTIAGSLAAAFVVVLWNRPFAGLPAWSVVTAIFIGPVAFAGDLLESWVKRRAGAKDSGTLLPGHGGVLDRIDSLVAAAPLVAAALIVLGRMG